LRVTVIQSMNWAGKDPTSSLPTPSQDSTYGDKSTNHCRKSTHNTKGIAMDDAVAYWAEKYRSRREKI
jgi:hypothetical protein